MAMNHDMAEQLARRIRAVLGEFNDDDKGVETLVRELAEQRRAHITQPAQAVDVGSVNGVIVDLEERARNGGDAFPDEFEGWAETLTRALSAEKAGPVGDDADAQWALRFKAAVNAIESEEDQPMTAACGLLLIDACVERKAKTVTLNFDGAEHKDGRDLGDWTVTVECRRKAPLPASPTPDKEGA